MLSFRIDRRFVPGITAGLIALAVSSCGSTPLDPNDFEIVGTWSGNLVSVDDPTLSFGAMQLTLDPRKDGEEERYDGDGVLFGLTTNFRFQQVLATYTLADQSLEMTIFDFPGRLNVFEGVFTGSALVFADTVLCRCGATMVRAQSGN